MRLVVETGSRQFPGQSYHAFQERERAWQLVKIASESTTAKSMRLCRERAQLNQRLPQFGSPTVYLWEKCSHQYVRRLVLPTYIPHLWSITSCLHRTYNSFRDEYDIYVDEHLDVR